jgi:hypothetical protein
MTSSRWRHVATLFCSLSAGALLLSCSEAEPPRPATTTATYIPQGDDREIALACGRASILLYIMTLGDWPPYLRYLDPSAMPGYDPNKREQDATAAKYLGTAIRSLGIWNERIEQDPTLLTRALRENGWTIVTAGKEIAATPQSWSNLEHRVNWCLEHYDVEVPVATEQPMTVSVEQRSS